MTENAPPARTSMSDQLRHPTTILVLGALAFALLGFLVGAVSTSGYRADPWRTGPGVHMNGYNGGFPGGMMGRGSPDGGFGGGMMGWGPYGGTNAQQRPVVRVDAGQVKAVSGKTLTLRNGAGTTTVKLTPNTFVVVHTLAPK